VSKFRREAIAKLAKDVYFTPAFIEGAYAGGFPVASRAKSRTATAARAGRNGPFPAHFCFGFSASCKKLKRENPTGAA